MQARMVKDGDCGADWVLRADLFCSGLPSAHYADGDLGAFLRFAIDLVAVADCRREEHGRGEVGGSRRFPLLNAALEDGTLDAWPRAGLDCPTQPRKESEEDEREETGAD